MEKTLSIITPVLPSKSQWLDETAQSVLTVLDFIAKDVSWHGEWVVVIDGPGQVDLPEDPRIRTIQLPTRSGVAAARTVALSEASGDWVLPVDGDDILHAEGLADLLECVEYRRDISWWAHNRRLLDGQKTVHHIESSRDWLPGQLQEEWRVPFAFHPNSVLVKKSAALACGGWPALQASEDLALVLALNHNFLGRSTIFQVIGYRSWDGQTIAHSDFKDNKPVAFRVIESIVNAGRELNGRKPIVAPSAFGAGGVFSGTEPIGTMTSSSD